MTETQARPPSEGSPATSTSPETDVLTRIVRTKREEVARLASRREDVRTRVGEAPAPRGFLAAMRRPGSVSLIAEVKRRSPGAGDIRPDLDPAELARGYEAAGASALSVLTDGPYFGGSLDDLGLARAAVGLPVLRKDFTLDPLQVEEARAGGADAVLLIVRILDDGSLHDLRIAAEELGMTALVEVHDADELERALASGARLIGINNRDLATFTTRLATTLDLLASVPDDVTLISESGIRTREDVTRLGAAGVDGILVGGSLLEAPSPEEKARELAGVGRAERGAPTGGAP